MSISDGESETVAVMMVCIIGDSMLSAWVFNTSCIKIRLMAAFLNKLHLRPLTCSPCE